MSGLVKTVDDLISDVRSMLDEENRLSVDTDEDILPALNRAQDYASNILARHYESPLLAFTFVNTTAGQEEYTIPDEAMEERLEKVEVEVNSLYYPVTRLSYRDISLYETQGSTNIPLYYTVVGNRFRLVPSSSGAYRLRLWYLRDPLPLVKQQGRITRVDAANSYVLVDQIGEDLTTEQDQLDSYVNIIDGQSGKIKGSFQIKNIADNRITFKTSPTRTTVLNQTINTDMTALVDEGGNSVDVEADDYLCVIKGVCVPFFKKPFSNFLIQYAVAELRRKLGGPADMELRVLQDLEDQVERSWVGREQSLRVSKRNNKWDLPIRRYWGIRR